MLTVSREMIEKNIRKYFEHIEQTGEDVVVTINDVPAIRLIPLKSKHKVEDLFKDVRGRVQFCDDILKPETEEWEEA